MPKRTAIAASTAWANVLAAGGAKSWAVIVETNGFGGFAYAVGKG